MTIKQQGGVFGRNPTFNEVDAATGNITTVNATTVNATTVDATTAQADGVEITSASGDIDMLWAAGSVHRVGSDYAGSYFTGMRVSADTRNVDLISLDPSGLGNFRVFTGVTEVEQLSINPTGNVTLHTGNLIVANGKGIDFSATSGTGTSELFDDYEEGTWTPTLANSSGVAYTLTTALGYYRKVGSQVTIWFSVASSDNVNDPYYVILGDLPFSSGVDYLDSGCVGSDNASLNRSVVHRGKVRTNATARIYVFYHNGVATTFDFDDALGGMLTYFTA